MEPTTAATFAPREHELAIEVATFGRLPDEARGSRWRTETASPEYSGAAGGSERIGPRGGAAPSAFTASGTLAVHEAREVYAVPDSESLDSESLDADAMAADNLLELGDEIATLAAHIHAATYRLLTRIAEFDRRGGWKAGGHRTCAHWLAHRTGMALGAARERVRAARALETLLRISESMSRGELSFSKVRALTRAATPANETELLALAHAGTAAQVERLVRGWRRHDRLDEAELEREQHRSRRFSVTPDADGMYIVRGRLDPEVGALLMRAIEAASDALYRTERSVINGTAETPRRPATLHAALTIPHAAGARPGETVLMPEEVAESVRSRIARRMVTDATREEVEIGPFVAQRTGTYSILVSSDNASDTAVQTQERWRPASTATGISAAPEPNATRSSYTSSRRRWRRATGRPAMGARTVRPRARRARARHWRTQRPRTLMPRSGGPVPRGRKATGWRPCSRSSRTAHAFPRKRLGGLRVTRGW